MSTGRKATFAAVALLLLFLGAEILSSVVLHKLDGSRTLAVAEAFDRVQASVAGWKRDDQLVEARLDAALSTRAQRALKEEFGAELRAELERRYAEEFRRLVRSVRETGSEFLVLDFLDGDATRWGRFIAELAEREAVHYLDAREATKGLPEEFRHLQPADGHLTRAANLLIVHALAEKLGELADHRSGQDYSGKPRMLGDVLLRWPGSGRRELKGSHPELGYRLLRNRHGLRMARDLDIPKRRQRILALGDSFTFGEHLNNQDTWPSLLEWQHPELEVLNAGISGYTITDQRELFEQRARHAAADITILQVCDNDLLGLTAFLGNHFARTDAGELEPSPVERAFFAALRDKDAGDSNGR